MTSLKPTFHGDKSSQGGTNLHGTCHCAAIQYTIYLPPPPPPPDYTADLTSGSPSTSELDQLEFPLVDFDHCDSCRSSAGTLFQTWVIVPQSWVLFWFERPQNGRAPPQSAYTNDIINSEIGRHVSTLVTYPSSPEVVRGFCGRCGTNIFYAGLGIEKEGEAPESRVINLTMGSLKKESLEHPACPKPIMHSWWGDQVQWVKDMIIGKGKNVSGGQPMAELPTYLEGLGLE